MGMRARLCWAQGEAREVRHGVRDGGGLLADFADLAHVVQRRERLQLHRPRLPCAQERLQQLDRAAVLRGRSRRRSKHLDARMNLRHRWHTEIKTRKTERSQCLDAQQSLSRAHIEAPMRSAGRAKSPTAQQAASCAPQNDRQAAHVEGQQHGRVACEVLDAAQQPDADVGLHVRHQVEQRQERVPPRYGCLQRMDSGSASGSRLGAC